VDLDAAACVAAFQQLGVLRPEANLATVTDMVRQNFASGRVRSKASKPKASAAAATAGEPPGVSAAAPEPVAEGSGSAAVDVSPVAVSAATAASRKALPDFVLPAQLAFVARALAQMEGVGKALVGGGEKRKRQTQTRALRMAGLHLTASALPLNRSRVWWALRLCASCFLRAWPQDPEFEFIAAAAPALVEVKGASAYLEGWLSKQLRNFGINLPSSQPKKPKK
jgi:hypothetical protein